MVKVNMQESNKNSKDILMPNLSNHCHLPNLHSPLTSKQKLKLKEILKVLNSHKVDFACNCNYNCGNKFHLNDEGPLDKLCIGGRFHFDVHKLIQRKCQFQTLSTAVTAAKQRAIWNVNKSGWKYSIVENKSSNILIGYLFQADSNKLYFTDENEFSIECVSNMCCSKWHLEDKSHLCVKDLKSTLYFIALEKYTFLLEYFETGSKLKRRLIFSPSYIDLLERRLILPENIVSQTSVCSMTEDINKVTSLFKDKLILDDKLKQNSYVCQLFVPMFKLWNALDENVKSKSVVVNLCRDTTKVECRSKDELREQISALTGENSNRDICIFTFRSKCDEFKNILLGNKYWLAIPFEIYEDFSRSLYADTKHKQQLNIVNIFKGIETVYKGDCLSEMSAFNNSLNLIGNIGGFQDVILKSPDLMQTCAVKAAVVDQYYIKDVEGSSSSEKRFTLCLVIKDELLTLRLYIPNYPKNLPSLLPYSAIILFGCIVKVSQQNNVYLKASSSFGVYTLGYSQCPPLSRLSEERWAASPFPWTCLSTTLSEIKMELPQFLIHPFIYSPKPFMCHGYLLRIISVKLARQCTNCLEVVNKDHNCFVKCEASFQVDDGSYDVVMHCAGDQVKTLLKFTDVEWNSLHKYVNEYETLKYSMNEKLDDIPEAALIPRVFHLACSRRSLKRYLELCGNIFWVSGEKSIYRRSFNCIAIAQLQHLDESMKLYTQLHRKLKNLCT